MLTPTALAPRRSSHLSTTDRILFIIGSYFPELPFLDRAADCWWDGLFSPEIAAVLPTRFFSDMMRCSADASAFERSRSHGRRYACLLVEAFSSTKNALLKAGNKNDRVDARKLSDLLRAGLLTPVYHGESGVRTLRELSRSYLTVTKDLTRVMNRLKGLYRSWAIPCAGQKVYSPRHRSAWLENLSESGVRRRAERLYQQLDTLVELRREARRELLAEGQKHPASELLRQIPRLGPIRVALAIALIQTPHRFRTKRQLWAYCGLALQTRSSGEYRYTGGQLQPSRKLPALRGLNVNHNHDLKYLFKSAATQASASKDSLGDFYQNLLATGMKPPMARLTLARKIAAIVLKIWKKGERFDPAQLKRQAA